MFLFLSTHFDDFQRLQLGWREKIAGVKMCFQIVLKLDISRLCIYQRAKSLGMFASHKSCGNENVLWKIYAN
jgi:hypothetical protein